MSEPHVVAALRAKRTEISGQIRDLERAIKRQRIALAHIDAAIRVFAPDIDPSTIRTKRRYQHAQYFAWGELSRTVLDTLRKAGEPLTGASIAVSIIKAKGFPKEDARLTASIRGMVLAVLRRFAKRGTVLKSGESRNALWALCTTTKPGQ